MEPVIQIRDIHAYALLYSHRAEWYAKRKLPDKRSRSNWYGRNNYNFTYSTLCWNANRFGSFSAWAFSRRGRVLLRDSSSFSSMVLRDAVCFSWRFFISSRREWFSSFNRLLLYAKSSNNINIWSCCLAKSLPVELEAISWKLQRAKRYQRVRHPKCKALNNLNLARI